MTEVEGRFFGEDCRCYHFVENSAYFVLNTDLLLTMLPNFEREAALKDSAFFMGSVFYP